MTMDTIDKFYPAKDDSVSAGSNNGRLLDWSEIATCLEEYIEENGDIRVFLDWSSSAVDYRGVYGGLASVNKAHLLADKVPSILSPLYWFKALKRNSSLKDMKLQLSNIFSILYSEGTQLLSLAHYADTNVDMTIKVIEFFFSLCNGQPAKGKIESYFTVSKENPDDTLEEDLSDIEEGDLSDIDEEDLSDFSEEELVQGLYSELGSEVVSEFCSEVDPNIDPNLE